MKRRTAKRRAPVDLSVSVTVPKNASGGAIAAAVGKELSRRGLLFAKSPSSSAGMNLPINLVAPAPDRTGARRFGKHAPRHDYRTLLFSDYAANLAPPPASYSVLDQVAKGLGGLTVSMFSALFPMDGNDVEGCCTIAGMAHLVTAYRAMIGSRAIPTAASVHKLYRKLSGGEDTGLNMLDVLNYWHNNAFDGDAILAFVKIDPRNHTHVQQAIQHFGGVYTGFQVQAHCIADFDAHRPWTPGKLTQDGHCVPLLSYDAKTVTALTWGARQVGTWGWVDACLDECYAIVPPEAKNAKFAPGFNVQQLLADLAAVTG